MLKFTGKKHIPGSTQITNDIVTNTISFILKPNDNGAAYNCKAINLATITPLKKSVTLEVNCEYIVRVHNILFDSLPNCKVW